MNKIVFFGTDEFASSILSSLLEREKNIVAVVTKPDRAKRRGGKTLPTHVKRCLLEKSPDTPLFQPVKASTPEFAEILRGFSPDLFVVVSYGEIINDELLAIPKLMPINIHPSALPKYRGASPLRSAILAGDRRVGIAIIEMVKAMDAGDILKMDYLDISLEENHSMIQVRVFKKSFEVLLKCLDDFENNSVEKKPQIGDVTFTKKFTKQDTWIDWTADIDAIINQIRAFGDTPGALSYVKLGAKTGVIKITKAEKISSESTSNLMTIKFSKIDGWQVSCKDGTLKIHQLQMENKKLMSVQDFINGSSGRTPELLPNH